MAERGERRGRGPFGGLWGQCSFTSISRQEERGRGEQSGISGKIAALSRKNPSSSSFPGVIWRLVWPEKSVSPHPRAGTGRSWAEGGEAHEPVLPGGG